MTKKLANMLFFILLCFSVINALESNIKTTNVSGFLDMKSCENHNLDSEICEFIKILYSVQMLESIFIENMRISRQNPEYTQFSLSNPFFVEMSKKVCLSFKDLSDKNLAYLLEQNFVYNDIFTNEERMLLPQNINIVAFRDFVNNACSEIKNDITSVEKKRTFALNAIMDSMFKKEKSAQAKFDKNVNWVFKSHCEKRRVNVAICEFANAWWNFSKLNESDMGMGDDVIKLFLSFSKDACEVSKKLTKQDIKFILNLHLDYNDAKLNQSEQIYLMCSFYERAKSQIP